MSLRVLNVAYPFAPAGPDAVGGAEQVLARIDQALVRAGEQSYVAGCNGTRSAGHAVEVFGLPPVISAAWRERAYFVYRSALEEIIDKERIDLVHFHGVDFHRYIPQRAVPMLATLHLPVEWYPREIFAPASPKVWLHCVSDSQHSTCPQCGLLLAPILNGVEAPMRVAEAKAGFALSLGRICVEKGFHLALDAARAAGSRFILAGEVFPHAEHQRYFADQIRPRLGPRSRYIGPVSGKRKRAYLARANCLLVPSLVAETSSLVAMEALACGTPVIAFRTGALPEIIEDGKTGFLVRDAHEMTEAIRRAAEISPAACRAAAAKRFSAEAMERQYLARYHELIARFHHDLAGTSDLAA